MVQAVPQQALEGRLALPGLLRGVAVAVESRALGQAGDLDAGLAQLDDVGAVEMHDRFGRTQQPRGRGQEAGAGDRSLEEVASIERIHRSVPLHPGSEIAYNVIHTASAAAE